MIVREKVKSEGESVKTNFLLTDIRGFSFFVKTHFSGTRSP